VVDPTVGPLSKVWTRGQKWMKWCRKWSAEEARVRDSQGGCANVSPPQRGGAVPTPLSGRWAEMARQLLRGARQSGRPPNRPFIPR